MTLKFVWGITGCGDYLQETFNIMKEIIDDFDVKVTVIISKQGELVLKWYKLLKPLKNLFNKLYIEISSNQPFLAGPLQRGKYKFLYISPATGNSVAKITHGIADTLITNCVAQTIKGFIPVYIYPVDQHPGEITTILPNGQELKLRMRKIDLDNVSTLKNMEGIIVLSHPSDIKEVIRKELNE
ncbi:MAG: archaeoflavoprotein AfpA [Candidatus Helarchaeota archaeon]